MITRFFSAVRRSILAIPGNPYAEINRLKRREGYLDMRVTVLAAANRVLLGERTEARTAKDEAQKRLSVATESWMALNANLSDQLEAAEMACEEFVRERNEMKRSIRAHAVLGLSFAQAAYDAEAAIAALSAELGEHVEANEALAGAVAELQIERDNTLPFLKAVEAKLEAVGITVDNVDGNPAVTVDTTKIATAVRARIVALANPAPIAA